MELLGLNHQDTEMIAPDMHSFFLSGPSWTERGDGKKNMYIGRGSMLILGLIVLH